MAALAGLSADGRFVLYSKAETDPSGITRSVTYVFDRKSARSELVTARMPGAHPDPSPGLGGCYGGSPQSALPNGSISADGRFVAFCSWSSLVPSDTNDLPDVFVRDRKLKTTVRINLDVRGRQLSAPPPSGPNAPAPDIKWQYNVAISRDGTRVLFQSGQDLLLHNAKGVTRYQYNLVTRRIVAIDESRDASRTTTSPPDAAVWGGSAAMSANGRYVVFTSASKLTPADTDDQPDVYLTDVDRRTTTLVSDPGSQGPFESAPSTAPQGTPVTGVDSTLYNQATIDGSGRYVAFHGSDKRKIVTNDIRVVSARPGWMVGELTDRVVVKDLRSGRTVRVTSTSSWSTSETSLSQFPLPILSASGNSVVFVAATHDPSQVTDPATYVVNPPAVYRVAATGGAATRLTTMRSQFCAAVCLVQNPTTRTAEDLQGSAIGGFVPTSNAREVLVDTLQELVEDDQDITRDLYSWHE